MAHVEQIMDDHINQWRFDRYGRIKTSSQFPGLTDMLLTGNNKVVSLSEAV